MPNMSHCRFQNTLYDLKECKEALDNEEELSSVEEKSKEKLLDLCKEIAMNYFYDEIAEEFE